MGFAVADQVHPVTGPTLPIAGGIQETVDDAFVGTGLGVVDERGGLIGCRGETGEGDGEASEQGGPIRLGCGFKTRLSKSVLDEPVDGVG
jgi:hypothetical protein